MDNEIVISYKLSKIAQHLLMATVNRPGKAYKNGKIRLGEYYMNCSLQF